MSEKDRSKSVVYIGLGSNLGDRGKYLREAKEAISNLPDTSIDKESLIRPTKPLGVRDQPDFLNQVIRISTSLSAEKLLGELLNIELKLGRIRRKKWGPREIDLDILFYNDQMIDKPNLKVPHPEILNRYFLIEQLAEIASELVHPITKRKIGSYKND